MPLKASRVGRSSYNVHVEGYLAELMKKMRLVIISLNLMYTLNSFRQIVLCCCVDVVHKYKHFMILYLLTNRLSQALLLH